MNKKTKIILIIVLIVAFIALIILLLHPWKSNKSDGTEYYMSKKYNYWFEVDNGQATLIKYTGEEYHVKLPSSVYGVPVTKLGEYEVLNLSGAAKRGIFEDSNVSEVSIPEGVTEICNDAFYSSGLCEVNIPSSVRVVGTRAFAFCKYLRSVEFETGSSMVEKRLPINIEGEPQERKKAEKLSQNVGRGGGEHEPDSGHPQIREETIRQILEEFLA
mgnify:CR=1 FL=1